MNDTCNIKWRLIHKCNYNCRYCALPKQGSFILMRERLMSMIDKIFKLGKTSYSFTLAGGEPALHPHLAHVVASLRRPGINSKVTVTTNGSREIAFYEDFSRGFSPDYLQFLIYIHPAHADLKQILMLISTLSESGHRPMVMLVGDPDMWARTENFGKALIQLRAIVPFSMGIELPAELAASYTKEHVAWAEGMGHEFNFSCQKVSCGDSAVFLEQLPNGGNEVCIAGDNYLRIEPDGCFFQTVCDKRPGNMPLWHPDSIIPGTRVVRCGSCDVPCQLRKFGDEMAARQYLADSNARAREVDAHILPDKTNLLPIQGLGRSADATSCGGLPVSGMLADKAAKIGQACSKLADEKSREMLQRLHDWARYADPTCAPPSDFSLPWQPDGQATVLYYGLNSNTLASLGLSHVQAYDITDVIASGQALHEWLQVRRELATCLVLGTVSQNVLELVSPVLFSFSPVLLVSAQGDEIVTIIQWLKANFPGYELFLTAHDGSGIWLEARPATPPVRRHIQPEDSPAITVALYVDDPDQLQLTLNLFLLQTFEDYEILILYAGADLLPAALCESSSGSIRTITFPQGVDRDQAFNAAIAASRGKFLLFAAAGDMPASDFLSQAMSEAGDKDIIVCGRASSEIGTAMYKGPAHVLAFAMTEPRIMFFFSRDLLLRSRANFTLGPVSLYLPAFSLAHGIGLCEQTQFYGNIQMTMGGSPLERLEELVSYVNRFWVCHNYPTEQRTKVLYWAYEALLPQIRTQIRRARLEGTLDDLFVPAKMRIFGSCKAVLCMALTSIASAHAPRRDMIVVQDSAEQMLPPDSGEISCQPWGDADTPAADAPALSVILTRCGYSHGLRNTLDSIFGQSLADFEMIAMCDAASEDDFALLRDYAESFANVRVYQLDGNASPGVCRSMGLARARGNYIIFADDRIVFRPGFFANAVSMMRKNGADFVLFSHGNNLGNDAPRLPDGRITGNDGKTALLEGIIGRSISGAIFDTEFIRLNGIGASEDVFASDEAFIYAVLSNSDDGMTSRHVAYNILNDNLHSIPLSYQHLHSVYSAMSIQQRCIEDTHDDDAFDAPDKSISLKRIFREEFLPLAAAFAAYTGFVPMSDADHAVLGRAHHFLALMLQELANTSSSGLAAPCPCLPPLASVVFTDGGGEQAWQLASMPSSRNQSLLEYVFYSPEPDMVPELVELNIAAVNARPEDLVRYCSTDRVVFSDSLECLQVPLIVHGCIHMKRHGADCVVLSPDVDVARILTGDEIIAAWAQGLMGDRLTNSKIFDRNFLLDHGGCGKTAWLALLCNARKVVVLPASGTCPEKRCTRKDNALGLTEELHFILTDAALLNGRLHAQKISTAERAAIWQGFASRLLLPLLRKLAVNEKLADMVLTQKRLAQLLDLPDLVQSIARSIYGLDQDNLKSFGIMLLHQGATLKHKRVIILTNVEYVGNMGTLLTRKNMDLVDFVLVCGDAVMPEQLLTLSEVCKNYNISLYQQYQQIPEDILRVLIGGVLNKVDFVDCNNGVITSENFIEEKLQQTDANEKGDDIEELKALLLKGGAKCL